MGFVAKIRSVRQMVTRAGLKYGSEVNHTEGTKIRTSDQMVCNLALQQIALT